MALQVLNHEEARFNSADMNVAYRMNVEEYQRLCSYSGELEENWGKPPGENPFMLLDNQTLVAMCGNVSSIHPWAWEHEPSRGPAQSMLLEPCFCWQLEILLCFC